MHTEVNTLQLNNLYLEYNIHTQIQTYLHLHTIYIYINFIRGEAYKHITLLVNIYTKLKPVTDSGREIWNECWKTILIWKWKIILFLTFLSLQVLHFYKENAVIFVLYHWK